jgi:hypothetical protein
MTDTTFSHQKANSPEARYTDGGLRSFFEYRDMGIAAATNGVLRVQLVRAARKSSDAKGGTGVHFHTANIHVVYMVHGWAKFDYDGVDTLVEAGDCCISGLASSTASTIGPMTWSLWKSSCRAISPRPRSLHLQSSRRNQNPGRTRSG